MAIKRLLFFGLAALLSGCNGVDDKPLVASPSFVIDAERITVSGISSGAYMAGQLHIAHSSLISGAAMIAGGPYLCANNSIKFALENCVAEGSVDIGELLARTRELAANGAIDELQNLADDHVWLFHGKSDQAVSAAVVNDANLFYAQLLPADNITLVEDVDVVHGMPTLSTGQPCAEFASPFINACDYDAAGVMLESLYGSLHERRQASGELKTLDQSGYADAQLLDHGYLYVPASCAEGETCGLHIAFHGCSQSAEFVDDAFALGAGYNEWADSNHLLVLYPQVRKSAFSPLNPLGCWDWWGYTGERYATNDGAQIKAIKNMIDNLMGSQNE